MFLCLVNNLIAVANMLLGASAAISAMTGIHVIAATFLLPVGVALYTFVGGIKATFLTDYMHTFTILIILCYFSVKVWTLEEIGSIGNLYDLVNAATERNPIAGNQDGSYFTMTSKGVSGKSQQTRAMLNLPGHSLWNSSYMCQFWTRYCKNNWLTTRLRHC